uniref:Peptidase A1 domain-containing protein n=1 Tax=Caenorhabditis tropicalis TaxID=1561998 RepID=A0A1I7ULP8_9PELO
MKAKQLLLNKLLIFFLIFELTNAFRKLTEIENEERLKNCGKPPDPTSTLYTARQHNWWAGHVVDPKWQQNVLWRIGVVLISPYHAVLSANLITDYKFTPVDCKIIPTYLKVSGIREINFSLSKAGHNSFEVDNLVLYGNCKRPESSLVIAEFKKALPIPYACFPDGEFYTSDTKMNAIIPYIIRHDESGVDFPYADKNEAVFGPCQYGRFCWAGYNRQRIGNSFGSQFSLPIVSVGDRPIVLGFAQNLKIAEKSFELLDFRQFSGPLCEDYGICPPRPNTTTIVTIGTTTTTSTTTETTTTTMTTTTAPTTTTVPPHVPAFIADSEIMDFETDFVGTGSEVEHLYAPENATIYFWLDEAGPKTPFKVANWSFYGDCRTPREENSFVMAEFEQKIPVPYACFPEHDSFYSARKLPMAIIPYRVVEPNQDPIFTQYSNGIFDECVDQRFSKWCWRGFKYNYVGHLDDIGYSRPLITSNYDRPTIVGFAWGHYLDRIREFFSLTPIRDYSSVLCEEFGICRGPGTTTVPTTLPPTTVYVPELIADFETMDFESDYNVTRKERTRSSARYSGFFLISIVLGLIQ